MTTKPTFKEKQWQARGEAILDAAVEIVSAKGFAALTMEDVADVVGISKPTLYQHFPSKELIMEGIAQRCLRKAADFMRDLDRSLPPEVRLKQVIKWACDFRLGPDSRLLQSVMQYVPPKREGSALLSDYQALFADIYALAQETKDAGQFRVEIDPAFFTHWLLTFFASPHVEDLAEYGLTPEKIYEMSLLVTFA